MRKKVEFELDIATLSAINELQQMYDVDQNIIVESAIDAMYISKMTEEINDSDE